MCMALMTGKNCRQLRLLIWNFLIGHFIHPVIGDECFTLVEIINLVLDPSNNPSIIFSFFKLPRAV